MANAVYIIYGIPFPVAGADQKKRITNQTKAERKITVAGSREEAILNFLDEVNRLNMHGILLTLEGQPLAEGYWKPWRAE